MICIALAAPDTVELLKIIERERESADMIEIRLDALTKPASNDLKRCIEACKCPVICTCRHSSEGGNWQGTEEELKEILLSAADNGASFVDIELSAGKIFISDLSDQLKTSKCGIIVSFHDFSGTPDRTALVDIMKKEQEAGADIGKIVVMASEKKDCYNTLSLYPEAAKKKFSLVAFSMGDRGRISRLACLAMGAPFTFAAPDSSEETAPGQIKASHMRKLFDNLF